MNGKEKYLHPMSGAIYWFGGELDFSPPAQLEISFDLLSTLQMVLDIGLRLMAEKS